MKDHNQLLKVVVMQYYFHRFVVGLFFQKKLERIWLPSSFDIKISVVVDWLKLINN